MFIETSAKTGYNVKQVSMFDTFLLGQTDPIMKISTKDFDDLESVSNIGSIQNGRCMCDVAHRFLKSCFET